ncbi:DoxX family protein [Nocardia huaxiensis]|uniref:DoxX family protein n=1 Tax=Nocardia huaxiensis TaxID=2755382 RepID=A0A7D6ZTA6_9NOCA|nr:DoxX family protein [Nocardia huaxiensis]QLY28109.1 DoxX family protein [Nocardia huaxiensis]UFS98452.1 DoxX family protein [Nocardia huaxiensis]
MKVASMVLAGLLAAEFASFGAGKLLALASMRKRAEQLGYSTAAYRGIGALEVAAAGGVLLGLAYPVIGVAAGGGLVLLMAGAIASHLRNHDGPKEIAPAAVSAVVSAVYVATLVGASW